MKMMIFKILMETWNELLTLTSSTKLQLLLLLRVGQLGHRLLAEQGIQISLVPGVGNADQDGEEQEGEDSLPYLHLVGTDEDKDDDQPDVCQDRGGCCDAEHNKVLNPDDSQIFTVCYH